MKYENGFLYKYNALSQEDQNAVLTFLNNQTNATQAIHMIILNHIKNYGTGALNLNITPVLESQSQSTPTTVNTHKKHSEVPYTAPAQKPSVNTLENKTPLNTSLENNEVDLKNF